MLRVTASPPEVLILHFRVVRLSGQVQPFGQFGQSHATLSEPAKGLCVTPVKARQGCSQRSVMAFENHHAKMVIFGTEAPSRNGLCDAQRAYA